MMVSLLLDTNSKGERNSHLILRIIKYREIYTTSLKGFVRTCVCLCICACMKSFQKEVKQSKKRVNKNVCGDAGGRALFVKHWRLSDGTFDFDPFPIIGQWHRDARP